MGCSLFLSGAALTIPSFISAHCWRRYGVPFSGVSASNMGFAPLPRCSLHCCSRSTTVLCSSSFPGFPNDENEEDEEESLQVESLRVPDHWLDRSRASKESEWLRITLHKWLDDEYCPEETNEEISEVAARSYYSSLMKKQTHLGEILLRMGRELQSISYQDSFHGAYSSANAAIELIAQRIEQESSRDESEGLTISTD